MFRALWNWLKSLFCCLPGFSRADADDQREVEPLLANDVHSQVGDKGANAAAQPASRRMSAALVIAEMRRLPAATLTTQEFCNVMADAYEGSTRTLDAMRNEEEKAVGYKLINQMAMQYVAEIDRDVNALYKANAQARNIHTSWNNIRPSVIAADMAEYGIAYHCEEFASKHLPKDDFNAAAQQSAWLNNIKTCFDLCKKLMAAYRKYTINNERQEEVRRAAETYKFDPLADETRMNAKTLKMVNDFNKRCEEGWKEEEAALAAQGRTRHGRGRYGTK